MNYIKTNIKLIAVYWYEKILPHDIVSETCILISLYHIVNEPTIPEIIKNSQHECLKNDYAALSTTV
jgi:hypothetical protein